MDLGELLDRQDGVVSRAQALLVGEQAHDVRRRVRRREWATVIPGVYVSHTGPTTWEQQAMAGVLHAATSLDEAGRPLGAGLGGHAALRQAIGPSWSQGGPIEVCIDRRRSVRPVAGYRFFRTSNLEGRLDPMRTPPRVRLDDAVLDLAVNAADILGAVQVVADACQSRYVSAERVVSALRRRNRVSGREVLGAALTDIADGTCSALEHLFLTDVIRAHGLAEPRRQSPRPEMRQFRDCEWEDLGLVVELDGRLFHDNARQRDRDLERDLDDAVSGRLAVRLGWGQVTRQRCRTAARLAELLGTEPSRCSDCQ